VRVLVTRLVSLSWDYLRSLVVLHFPCVYVYVSVCVCALRGKGSSKKKEGDGDSVVVELHCLAWSLGSRLCWLSDFSCVFRRLTNIISDLNPPNIAGERAWGLLGCHNILGILLTPRTRR
jgi:hypothetical protein